MGIFYSVRKVFLFLSHDLFANLILFGPLSFIPVCLIISIIFFILSLHLFIALVLFVLLLLKNYVVLAICLDIACVGLSTKPHGLAV